MTFPTEIALHVGLQKTGTTLVQRSLRRLRPALADAGIAYLDRRDVSALPALRGWAAFPDDGDPAGSVGDPITAPRRRRPELADEFVAQLRAAAVARCDEVTEISGRPPTRLLASNESLVGIGAPDFGPVYRPRAEAALGHFLEALMPQRVTMVLYVRRQDTLLESQYLQLVKQGAAHSFSDFAARATAGEYIRFADLAARFAAMPLVTTLRVRPFEVIGAGPERFIADLLSPFDVTFDPARLSLQVANPGLSAPALAAALALNPHIADIAQLRETRRFLMRTFPMDRYPPPQLFEPEGRRRVLGMYAASNRAFFARHVPDAAADSYGDESLTPQLANLI